MNRKCCMDVCTTLPAESQNNSLKYKSSNVNSRMNLSTSVRQVVDGILDRLECRKGKVDRELTQTNMLSQAPTNNYLIKKGQGLADKTIRKTGLTHPSSVRH